MAKKTIVIVGVLMVAYLATSAYFATELMRVPRIPLDDSPTSVGLVYEDVSFPSRIDNVALSGWYIPGGETIVVMVSSSIENRTDPNIGALEISRDLVKGGFSVLLFDLRGRGDSEGKGVFLTHNDRDIGGAIDYVKSRGHTDVAIVGFSTGAASSLIFASREDVLAVVSDSSFASVDEMVIKVGAEERGLPQSLIKFFKPGVFLMARVIYGYKRTDPVDVVVDIRCPIFFIHGELDGLIPVEDVHRLHEASDNPADQVWVIPSAEHCLGYRADSESYIRKVVDFLTTGTVR